jgi:hypothetical protein
MQYISGLGHCPAFTLTSLPVKFPTLHAPNLTGSYLNTAQNETANLDISPTNMLSGTLDFEKRRKQFQVTAPIRRKGRPDYTPYVFCAPFHVPGTNTDA